MARSFRDRLREFQKDAYRSGYEAGQEAARKGEPEPNWLTITIDAWRFARASEFLKEEKFRASDPWEQNRSKLRAVAFVEKTSSTLADTAELTFKVAEWATVVALFKFLAASTKHPAFEAIAVVLYVGLLIYLGRYFLPLILYETKSKNWLARIAAALVVLAAIGAAVGCFAAIGYLVDVIATNQALL